MFSKIWSYDILTSLLQTTAHVLKNVNTKQPPLPPSKGRITTRKRALTSGRTILAFQSEEI
jgi:hypothetical protein